MNEWMITIKILTWHLMKITIYTITQTHSSTMSTISARFSNTSLRAMMLGCCRACSRSTSRSTALLWIPSRLHAFLRVLINFPAHWVPVARSVSVRTCPKFPLCRVEAEWINSIVDKCSILVLLGNVRWAHYVIYDTMINADFWEKCLREKTKMSVQ